MYPWPWLQRPENCLCQRCCEWRKQQDMERMIRVLKNWNRKDIHARYKR
jgi:hypothetical protein